MADQLRAQVTGWALYAPTVVGGLIAMFIAARPYLPLGQPVPAIGTDLAIVHAAFVLVAGVFCSFLLALAPHVAARDQFFFGRRWGTLGGAADGFEVSTPAVILGAVLACLLALVILGWIAGHPSEKTPQQPCDRCRPTNPLSSNIGGPSARD